MTRFKTCCEKGYKAAIKLAAFCSGKSEAVVEASYKKWCKDDGQFDVSGMDMAPDEIMELLEAHESVNDADENECHEVLTCLQRESVFVDPEAEENTVPNDNVELAFEKVKGKEDLVFLLQSAGDPEDADMGTFQKKTASGGRDHLQHTLLEAMECAGDRFNALWRLAVHVRCGPGGVDSKWIANHQKARLASTSLNWHQSLEVNGKICVVTPLRPIFL